VHHLRLVPHEAGVHDVLSSEHLLVFRLSSKIWICGEIPDLLFPVAGLAALAFPGRRSGDPVSTNTNKEMVGPGPSVCLSVCQSVCPQEVCCERGREGVRR
jgi:hypothetical protein